MTTNNLQATKAILNLTLNNFNAITVEGKPGTFMGELTGQIILVKSQIASLIQQIETEINSEINS